MNIPTPQYKCCQCLSLFTQRPKAILDFWIWGGVCKQIHKKDIVSKTLGKIHRAKVVYCGECI